MTTSLPWLSFIVVPVAALAVSALTLFSGFGLGTLLMPVFALFFPVEVAVAATAVVHGLNNLFKLGLLFPHVERSILVRFGVPAIAAAFLGAAILTSLSRQPQLLDWRASPLHGQITAIKLLMGVLILLFAGIELLGEKHLPPIGTRWLPVGGALSGFFGGLSGHQGALRAAFLAPLKLSPPVFVATQAVLACMVDAARLLIYGAVYFSGKMSGLSGSHQWSLVTVATVFAFAGAMLGKRMLPKVTVATVRYITTALLILVGLSLAAGLV